MLGVAGSIVSSVSLKLHEDVPIQQRCHSHKDREHAKASTEFVDGVVVVKGPGMGISICRPAYSHFGSDSECVTTGCGSLLSRSCNVATLKGLPIGHCLPGSFPRPPGSLLASLSIHERCDQSSVVLILDSSK